MPPVPSFGFRVLKEVAGRAPYMLYFGSEKFAVLLAAEFFLDCCSGIVFILLV